MQYKVFWWSLPLVFLLASCAADVGDIDRSQPGKLKKSLFEDDWYYRQTVVDVPYTVGVTFIGEQSYIDRVRWEISEDFLPISACLKVEKDNVDAATDALANNFTDALANKLDVSITNRLF